MPADAVASLLRLVGRRLWRARFAAATRWALWGSATLMLAAAAVHVGIRPVAMSALATVIGALWISLFFWAAGRPPSQADRALWADRNLEGASAFSTLLEIRSGLHAPGHDEAVRWLEQWAAASVPRAQRLLAAWREPRRMTRPLVAATATAALAAIILALPGARPALPIPAAKWAASSAVSRPSAASQAESIPIEARIATTLRSVASDTRSAKGDRSAGADPAGNETRARLATAAGARAGSSLAREVDSGLNGGPSAGRQPTDSRNAPLAAASGRDVGDGRDNRASARPFEPIPASEQPSSSVALPRHSTVEAQADTTRQASFDERLSPRAEPAVADVPEPPPAMPPRAGSRSRLAPTRAAYIEAWTKLGVER